MTEEWEQIARDAWTRAESVDQRSAINEYAMDWLQRLDIVSKSEAATEDQRKSLTAFLDAYRSGSGAPVDAADALGFLTGLIAWELDRKGDDSAASWSVLNAAIILAHAVGVRQGAAS